MDLDRIRPGQTGEMEATVTKEMSINRMGREGADVLSTPGMLELMEWACIKATDDKLPEGYTTVGYAVDGLRHLAPTPIGNSVTVRVELTEVDRKPSDLLDRRLRGREEHRRRDPQAGHSPALGSIAGKFPLSCE